jgi:acyl-coenzyme A synthetase/AMP-(fatty) acid ligase
MRTDAAGRFYFVGRRDDLIKTRGERVSPREVEDVLYGVPGVVKAAVVGEPDPVLGARVKAFIVSRNPDLTEAEVMRHCRRELEDFMVPASVEFVAHLPTTSSGKVSKIGL